MHGMTQVVVDAHLHVYPWYDLGNVFSSLAKNLAAADRAPVRAAVLTERKDCSLFADLCDGRVALPAPWTVSPTAEKEALIVDGAGSGRLFLCAGRQIVTAERLEVLSLLADPRELDGLRAGDVIGAVTAAGGVPVLAWAPGKWLFGRGKAVRELVGRFHGGELLVGDTSLRPPVWGEPRLMAEASRKGIALAAGSDPLPLAGEERYAGSYATALEGPFDPARPAYSLKGLFRDPAAVRGRVGRRCGLLEALARIYRNGRAKR